MKVIRFFQTSNVGSMIIFFGLEEILLVAEVSSSEIKESEEA